MKMSFVAKRGDDSTSVDYHSMLEICKDKIVFKQVLLMMCQ